MKHINFRSTILQKNLLMILKAAIVVMAVLISSLTYSGTAGAATEITEFPVPTSDSWPAVITAGPDGAFWFVEVNTNKIGRITNDGSITEFEIPTPSSMPQGIATGPDGALWFTEYMGNKIGRITTDGTITEFPVPTNNSGLLFITAGADGALWFTEYGANQIGRITTDGTITEFPLPTPYSGPMGITSGADGAIWFTMGDVNKIGRITSDGTVTEFLVPTAGSYPFLITSGPDGAIWFTEYMGNNIGRLTVSDGVITEYSVPTANSTPEGITSGSDGAVWFTESGGNNIGRLDIADGTITEFPVPTAGSYASGIAAGTDGTVWFAEAMANKIGRLTTGSQSIGYSMSVAPLSFSEGSGANAATGTVSLETALDRDFTVALNINDTSEASVPASVTIPAGEVSATFAISAVDDTEVDGDQVVIFSHSAGQSSGDVALTVTDNDAAPAPTATPIPTPVYSVIDLHELLGITTDSYGGQSGYVNNLNDYGHLVGSINTANGHHAFLYRDGALVDLGVLDGAVSQAQAVNNRDVVTGDAFVPNGTHAFLWRNGVMQDIGMPGRRISHGVDINNAGQVAGYYQTDDNNLRAFLYQNGQFTDLSAMGGVSSVANSINASGTVVGYANVQNRTRAFAYSNGAMTSLGGLTSGDSLAHDINKSGKVVGYSLNGEGNLSAVLWANGSIADLGNLGGAYINSIAFSINNAGQIVGESRTLEEERRAFIHQDGQMQDLNSLIPADSGWTLETASVINNVGQILGTGTRNGQRKRFLLTPIEGVTPPVNNAPVAGNGTVTTDEDASVNGTLSATDEDGDALTYSIVNNAGHGTVTITDATTGAYTYTPNADFNGTDSFTFQANDGMVDSNVATVSVTAYSASDPPVAVNDSYTANEDQTLTIDAPGVLANDTDADGDALTARIVNRPSSGSVVLNSDGSFTYTPDPNFTGDDSFSYVANDGALNSNVATVSITVGAVQDAPVAFGQSVSTNEDTATAITLTAMDADGDALTYTLVHGPAHGTLSGSIPNFTYTPAANYSGGDSFTFKVNDGNQDSNVATVNITVEAVNDPPVASGQIVSTSEDIAKAITLSAVDVEGSTLTYSIVAGPANGTLSGTGANLTYTPAANFNGSDSFTFKANDGGADSNIVTVSITIAPVNDAPKAVNDTATTRKGVAVSIAVLANDEDVDGDTLTIISATKGTKGGTASIVGGTSIKFTPKSGFTGTDTFTYTIRDSRGLTATATVTVTVTR